MDRTQFNEALVSLVEYAAANANHVSKKDVDIYFKEILSDESMYDAIYSYLKENKISIDDMDNDAIEPLPNAFTSANEASESFAVKNTEESEEELEFIEMYKNEMDNIEPLSNEERNRLILLLKEKDAVATARLTEDCLSMVHDIATKNKGRGLTLGDLIQEGNVGLILGLSEFDGEISDFFSFISGKISEAIDDAINMQISSERVGSHLADRMNNLDDLSKNLTEKLGHAPSVKELAEEMNISEDEVDTIIRTSLNVLSVEQADED